MSLTKPETHPPYRLRASAPCAVAGTSSMLRVARTSTLERRGQLLRSPYAPQQLAFDFLARGTR